MIVGFFFVRQIPLPPQELQNSSEYSFIGEATPVVDLEAPVVLEHENDSHTPLLNEDSQFTDREHGISVRRGTSLELSPTRSDSPGLGSHRRIRSDVHRPSFGSASRMIHTPPNISGRHLWMSGDFYLIFTIMSMRKSFSF
jgi:hypothetical protein